MPHQVPEYIALSDCVHGGLYRLRCHTFHLGVFDKPNEWFVGIRNKLGHNYLFAVYHGGDEVGRAYAYPTELLQVCLLPDLSVGHAVGQNFVDNQALVRYLQAAAERY